MSGRWSAARGAPCGAARLSTTDGDPFAAVYLATQVALREVVAVQDADVAVRAGRVAASGTATTAARVAGERVGIEVAEVVVKDVILPPELRSAYAEVVTGRQRALAQLEAARAETAALRHPPES